MAHILIGQPEAVLQDQKFYAIRRNKAMATDSCCNWPRSSSGRASEKHEAVGNSSRSTDRPSWPGTSKPLAGSCDESVFSITARVLYLRRHQDARRGVIHGHRHNTVLTLLGRAQVYSGPQSSAPDGLRNFRGRFVDRDEAMTIPKASGKPPVTPRTGTIPDGPLFSEDLYLTPRPQMIDGLPRRSSPLSCSSVSC